MKQVGFSEAKHHDGEHLVVDDYVNAMDRALRGLGGRTDVPAKRLVVTGLERRSWSFGGCCAR